MQYKVLANKCGCHPETCGCHPWKIVNEAGDKLATSFAHRDAAELTRLLNEKSKVKS